MTRYALQTLLESLLGAKVTGLSPLHGGSLSDVLCVDLDDGRRVVAKTGELVDREARMLDAMAATGARVPTVLAQAPGLIVLPWLPERPVTPRGWQDLGQILRKLHTPQARPFGWDEAYAFGAVAIPNQDNTNWPRFWADNRLLTALNSLPTSLGHRLETLAARLPDLLPAAPPAALLHGDLWAGNVLFSTGSQAWLIDPACYYGDGEVDLAMLTLFDIPGPGFFETYGPLAPGATDRMAIYQLWPALVHLRLFGAGYRAMVEARLDRLGV